MIKKETETSIDRAEVFGLVKETENVEKKKEIVSEETMTSHIQDMIDRKEWSKVLKVCAASKY